MRELLTFQMPATQSIELGANTIHAIITIDRDGQMVGDMMPYQDRKGKMVTPTMPNRGPQVIAIAGSDTVQYFNPDHERHYRSTIDRYEDVLAQFNVPEVSALLAFARSSVVRELDFSQIKVPKDQKTQQADFNKVRLAFIYAPTGRYLHECPSIIDYWIGLRGNKPISVGQIKCSITGKFGTP